jgi:hypothetical protein
MSARGRTGGADAIGRRAGANSSRWISRMSFNASKSLLASSAFEAAASCLVAADVDEAPGDRAPLERLRVLPPTLV